MGNHHIHEGASPETIRFEKLERRIAELERMVVPSKDGSIIDSNEREPIEGVAVMFAEISKEFDKFRSSGMAHVRPYEGGIEVSAKGNYWTRYEFVNKAEPPEGSRRAYIRDCGDGIEISEEGIVWAKFERVRSNPQGATFTASAARLNELAQRGYVFVRGTEANGLQVSADGNHWKDANL